MSKSNPQLIRLAHPLAFAAFLEKAGTPVDSYFRRQGLLLESDTSIGNIGAATGFPDKAIFTRVFPRVGGLSPREYREAQSETQT